MTKRKTLEELTLKNSFMFGAVMSDEENCRLLLERILEVPIATVTVSKEKSIVYHPGYKGVRLDVYAEDLEDTRYNIEMQVLKEPNPGKRSRYYHSQMDMELLASGTNYGELPRAYVIFICDYDPFGFGKYRYIFRHRCEEDGTVELQDESQTIFLSTCGSNEDEVPEALVKFLKFVKADLQESEEDFGDYYVERLQEYIQQVKQSREMGERFMLFEELLETERTQALVKERRETIFEFLEDLGTVPEDLKEDILQEEELQILKAWVKVAAHAKSIEEFMENM